MSKFAEELENTQKELESNFPGKFKDNIDVRATLLNKEIGRSKYIFGILEDSLELLQGTGDKKAECQLIGSLEQTLEHFTEGGGAGAEALTRLQALGVLEDIPKVTVLPKWRSESWKDSKVVVDKESATIDVLVYFNAHPPDKEGNETWQSSFFSGSTCMCKVTIRIGDPNKIRKYLEDLHGDYRELMKIKYPDHVDD